MEIPTCIIPRKNFPSKISLKSYEQQKLTVETAKNSADSVIQYILIGLQSIVNLSAKADDILEIQESNPKGRRRIVASALTSCTDNFLVSKKRFWNHQIPAAGPNYEPIMCSQGPAKQNILPTQKNDLAQLAFYTLPLMSFIN